MTRIAFLLTLGIPVILAQMPEKPDLLKRTDELERLIAAGEWDRAAESSRSLKNVVTEARNRSLAVDGNQLADAILHWLPADTETFVVAQQPFPITKRDDTVIPTALQDAQGYVLGLLNEAEQGKLTEAILSRTVRLAAIGARNFRNHAPGKNNSLPLGMIAFDGCAVYAFAQPIPETFLARSSDELLMGHRVWVSKGTQNDSPDTDTLLVSLFEPNLVVACNGSGPVDTDGLQPRRGDIANEGRSKGLRVSPLRGLSNGALPKIPGVCTPGYTMPPLRG